jgi:hypothetical protein
MIWASSLLRFFTSDFKIKVLDQKILGTIIADDTPNSDYFIITLMFMLMFID